MVGSDVEGDRVVGNRDCDYIAVEECGSSDCKVMLLLNGVEWSGSVGCDILRSTSRLARCHGRSNIESKYKEIQYRFIGLYGHEAVELPHLRNMLLS